MPELEPSQPADEPRPPSAWGWLKHPWVLLIFGSVISLGLWVGIGVWIEHRQALVIAELERTPGVTVSSSHRRGPLRLPVWLPDLFMSLLPDPPLRIVLRRVQDSWEFTEPLTERELRLIDQVSDISEVTFHDTQTVSDEALLRIIQRHSIERLGFSRPRRLTARHLAALASGDCLSHLHGLQGPFDQLMVDELARIRTLGVLRLEGSLEQGASLGAMPALEVIEWNHSELSDEQFARFATSSERSRLTLRQTHLTAKSWPALETLKLGMLELESPHIDDTIARSLISQQDLSRIRLRGGSLSDAAVKEFLTLSDLQYLEVEGRNLTIASVRLMQSFSTSSNSRMLDPCFVIRGGPHVTDEWLAELGAGTLSGIGLLNSAITDQGVEHLKDHRFLNLLYLPGSQITDRSMSIFSTLPALIDLDLRNTAITDKGLRELSLTNNGNVWRFSLHVGGTHVTKQGVDEFHQRHPKASVYGVVGIEMPGEFDHLIPLDDQSR